MWAMIKEMVTSKKFAAAVFAILATVCTALAGEIEWATALTAVWGTILAYLGAQGLADVGKSKAKIEAEEKKTE